MTVTGEQDDKRNLKNTPSFALDTPSSLARSPPAQRLSARADVLDAATPAPALLRCLAAAWLMHTRRSRPLPGCHHALSQQPLTFGNGSLSVRRKRHQMFLMVMPRWRLVGLLGLVKLLGMKENK
jgi:hypothetical protein